MNGRALIIVAAFIAATSGCRAARVAWTPGRDHPANPEASTGRTEQEPVMASSMEAPAQSSGASDHAGHSHGAEEPRSETGAAANQPAYACPMHPEVTGDEPSRCPECGMKLVPADKPHGHKDHQP